MKKSKFIITIAFASVLMLTGCSNSLSEESSTIKNTEAFSENNDYTPSKGLPIVEITIKDGGIIRLELYPDIAPNTVNNFILLADSGFYDGLTFHRVINGFMIQGGDPSGDGRGNPGYSIDGEFSSNGFENKLSHKPGVISMARSKLNNSAGCQFFIVQGNATNLDGDYAAFGNVYYGISEVNRIAEQKTDNKDKPLTDIIIESININLNGYSYSEPKTNKI